MNATTPFHYILAFNVQYQPQETGLNYNCSILLCIGSGWEGVNFPPTVLSFALVARKVLLTHHCFGYIWIAMAQPQCYLSRFPPTTTKGLSKILWEDKKHHPKLTKEILHISVIEPKKWERKRGICYNVCLWEQPPCILKLCFPGGHWTLLADALCSYTCKVMLLL